MSRRLFLVMITLVIYLPLQGLVAWDTAQCYLPHDALDIPVIMHLDSTNILLLSLDPDKTAEVYLFTVAITY